MTPTSIEINTKIHDSHILPLNIFIYAILEEQQKLSLVKLRITHTS